MRRIFHHHVPIGRRWFVQLGQEFLHAIDLARRERCIRRVFINIRHAPSFFWFHNYSVKRFIIAPCCHSRVFGSGNKQYTEAANTVNITDSLDQIINIESGNIGGAVRQTANARDLHAFLKVATRFNDWIASRIDQYGFIENQDFATFTENPVKGRPTIEYAISIDMAKELAMVERNAEGKQARQYFIECERRALAVVPAVAVLSPATISACEPVGGSTDASRG